MPLIRTICATVALLALVACNPQTRSSAGQTPLPSNTTLAQANSTAAPSGMARGVSPNHYVAKTSSDLHGVAFGLWSNGRPVLSFSSPGMSIDLTNDLRLHANRLAITWHRMSTDGRGTLMVLSSFGSKVVSKTVNPSSPAKGQQSFQIIANP